MPPYCWAATPGPRPPGSTASACVYSYASGDKSAADGTSQTFQIFLPRPTCIMATMDLNSLQNLHDIRLAYTFKPRSNVSVGLGRPPASTSIAPRTAGTMSPGVARAGGTANTGTGYAVSPAYSRTLARNSIWSAAGTSLRPPSLEIGVSHYFRGDYIKQSLAAAGSKDASYSYVQITLNL